MHVRRGTVLLVLTVLAMGRGVAQTQSLDLLIQGGRVIDTRNGIDGVMDVGIANGEIAEVAESIAAERAETVVDASGLIVTPSLVGAEYWDVRLSCSESGTNFRRCATVSRWRVSAVEPVATFKNWTYSRVVRLAVPSTTLLATDRADRRSCDCSPKRSTGGKFAVTR